ncbi:MAG: hypothetical protein JWN34_4243 [Bryobacterales bacterium]|nr:hypothetical protein [Bryobacterales bacterium]
MSRFQPTFELPLHRRVVARGRFRAATGRQLLAAGPRTADYILQRFGQNRAQGSRLVLGSFVTDRLGDTRLRTFTNAEENFWREQNPAKTSKWAKLANEDHAVAREMASSGGSYTGRMLIDGEIYETRGAQEVL